MRRGATVEPVKFFTLHCPGQCPRPFLDANMQGIALPIPEHHVEFPLEAVVTYTHGEYVS